MPCAHGWVDAVAATQGRCAKGREMCCSFLFFLLVHLGRLGLAGVRVCLVLSLERILSLLLVLSRERIYGMPRYRQRNEVFVVSGFCFFAGLTVVLWV